MCGDFLPGMRADVEQQPIAAASEAKLPRHHTHRPPEPGNLGLAGPVAQKSAAETHFPFGITSTCTGACGWMSWKANAQASS